MKYILSLVNNNKKITVENKGFNRSLNKMESSY